MKSIMATVVLCAFVSTASAFAQDVMVYAFTAANEAGFVDADLKARQDALADLRKALDKRKGIVLIDQPDSAHVRVEILGRGYEATGGLNRRGPYELGPDVKADKEMTIRARLLVGNYETPLVVQTDKSRAFESARWQDLAKRLAGQIEQWVKDNRSKLLAKE